MKTILILILTLFLSACSTTGHIIPAFKITCKGKGNVTVTGNANVMVGSVSNNATIQADCGSDGFYFEKEIVENELN